MPEPVILALNRNQRNLDILTQILGDEGYQVSGVLSPEELDREVEIQGTINLVLMDISGFGRSIWDSCERLRIMKIPFLVLSPHHQQAVEKQSRMLGAQGVMVKPLVVRELLLLIKSLIED